MPAQNSSIRVRVLRPRPQTATPPAQFTDGETVSGPVGRYFTLQVNVPTWIFTTFDLDQIFQARSHAGLH